MAPLLPAQIKFLHRHRRRSPKWCQQYSSAASDGRVQFLGQFERDQISCSSHSIMGIQNYTCTRATLVSKQWQWSLLLSSEAESNVVPIIVDQTTISRFQVSNSL